MNQFTNDWLEAMGHQPSQDEERRNRIENEIALRTVNRVRRSRAARYDTARFWLLLACVLVAGIGIGMTISAALMPPIYVRGETNR